MKTKYNSTANWYLIAGEEYYFRSKWEHNFAQYLQWQLDHELICQWAHEPETFGWVNRLGNPVKYKPDFCVVVRQDREIEIFWYEIKGYMDARSKSKIEGFRKAFPEKNLIVIDKKWFARNSGKLRNLVPGWL